MKKVAKKKIKKALKNKSVVIAIAIIIVVAIIAVGVVYVVNPDIINNIVETLSSNEKQNAPHKTNTNAVIHNGDLAVYFIDIGQGDCIYIEFPNGKDMLIDAGNANFQAATSDGYKRVLGELQNYNKDDIIDYVMVTHGDKDHVSVMDDIFGEFQINKIFMPNIRPSDEKIAEYNLDEEKLALFTDPDMIDTGVYVSFFVAALSEPNCEIVLNVGEFSIIEETYRFDFYCLTVEQWAHNTLKDAHEKNEVSPIGILEYNGKRIVFTGDSNEENEPYFVERIGQIDCDVLKVGHHGSHTSSMPEFLDAITCEYAIMSCNAAGNTFVHPRQATIDRFIERNYLGIYRTDLHGTINLIISGDTITIVTQKDASLEDVHKGADTLKNEAA